MQNGQQRELADVKAELVKCRASLHAAAIQGENSDRMQALPDVRESQEALSLRPKVTRLECQIAQTVSEKVSRCRDCPENTIDLHLCGH